MRSSPTPSLPADLEPAAWALDAEADYPAEDRQELHVFGADGQMATIPTGSHAFAWRLPGVIAGALMAACLYLLARILFARRLVAGLVAAFALVDGMFFVQSRIGMNDVYVGLFIVAAYTVFAAVWTGWWRWRGAFWVAMPVIGVLLGLALASKWVAAYAIGAMALLLLVRSALGRVVAILGLIAITSVLGYLAISVPEGQGLGNLPFLAMMVGLTLVAVVAAVFHPIAWTDDEMRFAVIAPAALGALLFFGTLASGRLDIPVTVGPVAVTPLLVAIVAALGSLVVYMVFRFAGGIGYGPLAGPRAPGRPAACPGTACAASGRLATARMAPGPAAGLGGPLPRSDPGRRVRRELPAVGVHREPSAVGGLPGRAHRPEPGGPDRVDVRLPQRPRHGPPGVVALVGVAVRPQARVVLPGRLRRFDERRHLRRRQPRDLVARGRWRSASWRSWRSGAAAWRWRSSASAFAAQWVSWSRIDRAAFQYHYYTALPFVILALAYLVAELWHGPSRRTWLVVRLAGAAAIVAPAALWLLRRPLCAFVGVERANPGSQACPAVIPDLVLTLQTAGAARRRRGRGRAPGARIAGDGTPRRRARSVRRRTRRCARDGTPARLRDPATGHHRARGRPRPWPQRRSCPMSRS